MRVFSHFIVMAFFCMAGSTHLQAQELLGTRLSNYAGINAANLNPAAVGNMPYNWDLNIVTVGAFVETNYAYLLNQSVLSAQGEDSWEWQGSNSDLGTENVGLYDYDNTSGKKRSSFSAFAMLPSLAIRKGSWTFGFISQLRAEGNASGVAGGFSYYSYDNLPVGTSFQQDKVSVAAANWVSLGLHLGKTVQSTGFSEVSIGANVNYLLPVAGGFFQLNESATVTKTENGIDLSSLDANFAHYRNGEDWNPLDPAAGRGLSVDLGMQVKQGIDREGNYTWRFGASIVDLGYLHFSEATAYEIKTDETVNINNNNYEGVNDEAEFAAVLSREALGDPTAAIVDRSFKLFTPAGISLQADYRLMKRIFLSGLIVRRLAATGNTIKRTNMVAIAPRFESRWLEVQLPISFINDSKLRTGLSMRLGYLTIGSEDLGSWMKSDRLQSADLYVSLKVNPFNVTKGQRNRNIKAGKVSCPRIGS